MAATTQDFGPNVNVMPFGMHLGLCVSEQTIRGFIRSRRSDGVA